MGAYVASAVTSEYPERVESVIFIDGGFWRDYPLTMSPDELLDLRLGPFLAKFRRRWNSIDEYLDYYRNTPVYPTGIDAYGRVHFEYDLAKLDNKLVAKISEECVRTDWRDVVDHDTVGKRLEQVRVPALLLTAPQGLTGTGDEVITPRVRAELELRIPQLRTVEIPDSNHHTILLSKAGASTVANEIAAFAG
ncbi:hypothetical protein B0I33_102217 [Prauserella shujinwangii]|uniref:Alpha/beta hydrolase family protein n=2 Tax=Prauserella shujinwangii TaxID=1453103 RepID=A0A2T0M0I0_9PSEU|nr:hypothetical protein B0I33_102217 [Prauserella shujinwangii]